jgi:hypothetical protein
MLSFNYYLLITLTLHMNSHLWWVHAHYSPQLVELWYFVSSLLRYINRPHEKNRWSRRRPTTKSTSLSRWRLLVNFMAPRNNIWFALLLSSIFVRYFHYVIMIFVTFISIHFVIICDVHLWRTYGTHLALSLKSGCYISARSRPRARLPTDLISSVDMWSNGRERLILVHLEILLRNPSGFRELTRRPVFLHPGPWFLAEKPLYFVLIT